MPTAGSNFSRYIIPSDLDPDGICCISVPVPNDRQWIAQFLGAIYRMSVQSHYERDAAHSARIVAARWREIWIEVNRMTCCDQTAAEINIAISSKRVQNMLFALSWQQIWLDNSSTVSLAYYEIPDTYSTDAGDAGDDIDKRQDALCFAVQGWIHEVCNYMESFMLGNWEDALSVVSVGAGAIAGFTGLALPVVVAAFAIPGALVVQVYLELRDQEYREYLICRMFDNLQGKDPDVRADFNAALTADPNPRPEPETPIANVARDLIETYLRSQLNNLDNYLMFAGQLGTAMDLVSDDVDSRCPCGEWEHIWLDGYGLGTWDIIPYDIHPVGSYNAVDDRAEGDCLVNDGHGIRMSITFPARVITQIVMSISFFGNQASSARRSRIGIDGDFDKFGDRAHGNGPASEVHDTGVISSNETDIVISNFASTLACAPHYAYITKIIMRGEGLDPFE